MSEREKLILDVKALEKMGLNSEAIYTVEFDLYNGKKVIPKNATKEEKKHIQFMNKLARKYRNKLAFILKFKLFATKHLDSSWLIDEKFLEVAIKDLNAMKEDMRAKGFKDIDKRIKIIPILTTVEGYQYYDDKKAEFLLDFLMEHIKYAEKGIKEQRMSESTLWRCKQVVSIVMAISEELKNHKRYNEITDTISILDELVGEASKIVMENKKEKQKAKEKESED